MGILMIYTPEVAILCARRVREARAAEKMAREQGYWELAQVKAKTARYYEKAIRDYANRLLTGY